MPVAIDISNVNGEGRSELSFDGKGVCFEVVPAVEEQCRVRPIDLQGAGTIER
jgi:hypothetical protein